MTNHTIESKLAEALRRVLVLIKPLVNQGEDYIWRPTQEACIHITRAIAAYDASLKQGAVVEPAWHTNPSIDASARRVFGTPPTPHATTDTTDAAQGAVCACTIADPCSYACSCAHPFMSGGCDRCATYGSPDQQSASAEAIAVAIPARDAQPIPAEQQEVK